MKIISTKRQSLADWNRIRFIIILRKCNDQQFDKGVIFRKNK